MSNIQNTIIEENLWEKAQDITQMMIDDREISYNQKETMEEEVYKQLYEELYFSIEDQTDDDSGDDY